MHKWKAAEKERPALVSCGREGVKGWISNRANEKTRWDTSHILWICLPYKKRQFSKGLKAVLQELWYFQRDGVRPNLTFFWHWGTLGWLHGVQIFLVFTRPILPRSPCSGHRISSTGPSVLPFRGFSCLKPSFSPHFEETHLPNALTRQESSEQLTPRAHKLSEHSTVGYAVSQQSMYGVYFGLV